MKTYRILAAALMAFLVADAASAQTLNNPSLSFPDGSGNGKSALYYGANQIQAVNGLFGYGLLTYSQTKVYNGSTYVDLNTIVGAAAAGNAGAGNLAVEEGGRPFVHIATATSTAVKASKGFLHTLNIGTCVSGATVSLYDNASSATTPISVVTCPASTNGFSMTYDVAFSNGLYVVTSAATDVTVAYR